VNRHDARVLEIAGDLGFAQESDALLAIISIRGANALERDIAVQAQLPGSVNGPHSAVAHLADNLVIVSR
jgi:hypothetical protein